MNVFKQVSLELQKSIEHLGITEPTEIQIKSIPSILEGKDVLGESATGSGKTLAFGCGVIEKTVAGGGLQALILTPTRELAEQVKEALRKLAYHKKLNMVSVYGGVSIGNQVQDLRRADVVVATPGRTLDHLQRGTINLQKVKVLVLDEADRMLDMGFIDDVEQIIKSCPNERQTLFFSATLDNRIKSLAKKYTHNAIQVSAVIQVDPAKLKQVYYDIQKNMKIAMLVHLLQKEREGLVMVFCNTRRTTDFVVKNLKNQKIDAIAIHGGLTQNKRTKTIGLFNSARVSVLVCTDVAARGLHIDNVSHVYNYEIPKDSKDYVHRIGRTARAGEAGKVVNLLSEHDHDNFNRLQRDYHTFRIEKLERPFIERIPIVMDEDRERRGRSDGRGFQGGRGSFPRRESSGGRWNDRDSSKPRQDGRSRFGNRDGERSSSFHNSGRSGHRSSGRVRR